MAEAGQGGVETLPEAWADWIPGIHLEALIYQSPTSLVFKARSAAGAIMALKIGRQGQAAEAAATITHEFNILRRFNSPQIIQALSGHPDHHPPYFTMPFIEGWEIRGASRRIVDGPRRLRQILIWMGQLALALQIIHDKGVIHCDIKATNLRVDRRARLHLLDFGIAEFQNQRRGEISSRFAASLAYASPEQIQGQSLTHRTDLYSLGILLYELVVGRRPFIAGDERTLMLSHIQGQMPDPRQFKPQLPEGICLLLQALLAKRPENRPVDGGQVARYIRRLLPGLP